MKQNNNIKRLLLVFMLFLSLGTAGTAVDKNQLFLDAIQKGNLKIAAALLSKGADVESRNPAGTTALILAASKMASAKCSQCELVGPT
jgi:hypothetical protein